VTPPGRYPADHPDADDRLWGGRRWTGVAAVVFFVLVLALTLVVVLGRGHQGAGSEAAAGRGSAPSAVAGGTATPPAADTQSPGGVPLTAAPAGVVWRLVDGVALPFSAVDGPRSTAGGVASGFSDSPAGALLACVQTAFRIGSVNPADQAAVVRVMVTGAGQVGLLASRPATAPAVKPQQAGFRFLSYSADHAVIGLAWRVTDVAAGSSRFVDVGELDMSWAGGDWRLVDDGSQAPPPTGLDAQLTGYVPFGGA
jgi:hypothetical protein